MLKTQKKKTNFSQLRICRSPPPLRNGPIFLKDANSAESNEKSIFRFLFFSSYGWWYLKFTGDTPGLFKWVSNQKKSRSKMVKLTEKMSNELKRLKNQFSDFFFLSWLYLQVTVFTLLSKCVTDQKKIVGGFRTPHPPPDPACFWIEFPNSLVSVRIRLAKISNSRLQFVVEYRVDHNSKKKSENWFSIDSALHASFMKIDPLLRGGGEGGLHIRSWERSHLRTEKKNQGSP